MLLTSTTDQIQLLMEATGQVYCVVDYIDRVISTGAVGEAQSQRSSHTSIGDEVILSPPAADTERKVLAIHIRNVSGTEVADVNVFFDANGTFYELSSVRLYLSEMFEWEEHAGWHHTRRTPLPVYAMRLSDMDSRASAVVTGSDSNMVTVHKTEVPIAPIKALGGSAARILASFYAVTNIAAASTTGLGVGLMTPNIGFGMGRNTSIRVVTNSATDATKANRAHSVDQVVAAGTSATVAQLLSLGVGAVGWTENSAGEPEHCAYLGMQSEVGGSLVTVPRGAFMEVFEHTG